MTIVFFSNVLNNHQVALCDELYRLHNGNFYFVETSQLNAARKAMGFKQFERPYLIQTTLSEEYKRKAELLAITADVAIMGAESYPYLRLRINNSNGVTFSCSERWLKKGIKNILSRTILRQFILYLTKGYNRRWYMLGSSAYQANDMRQLKIFKNRVFKWGYFPKYPDSEIPLQNNYCKVRILWVASLIPLKHPEMIINLAEMLLKNNKDFEITMIGDGEMAQKIKMMRDRIPELTNRVIMKGYIPNKDVLEEMSRNDIFCFTSNRLEGWGAVLGEAMACGCCPVSSADTGATPFLIRHGKNGVIFKTGNIQDLYEKVVYLIDNPIERRKMADAARETMLKEWNAERAAREFLSLAKMKLSDGEAMPLESTLPASPAHPVQLHKTI